MFKKIIIAVAMSFGVASVAMAADPIEKQLAAALNSPAIKQQLTHLVQTSTANQINNEQLIAALNGPGGAQLLAQLMRANDLQPEEKINPGVVAAYNTMLLKQVAEQTKKPAPDSFAKMCAKAAKKGYLFIAPNAVGYGFNAIVFWGITRMLIGTIFWVGQPLQEGLIDPLLSNLMNHIPPAVAMMIAFWVVLDMIEKKA